MGLFKRDFKLFAFGGIAYGLIEILWRRRTHWSMVLTGGTARLSNLALLISKKTLLHVSTAENPENSVAIGTGKALNELDSLEGNALNRRAPYL